MYGYFLKEGIPSQEISHQTGKRKIIDSKVPTGRGDNVGGKNAAPVDMVNFPAGFHTCQVVGLGISGCHQQYVSSQGGTNGASIF